MYISTSVMPSEALKSNFKPDTTNLKSYRCTMFFHHSHKWKHFSATFIKGNIFPPLQQREIFFRHFHKGKCFSITFTKGNIFHHFHNGKHFSTTLKKGNVFLPLSRRETFFCHFHKGKHFFPHFHKGKCFSATFTQGNIFLPLPQREINLMAPCFLPWRMKPFQKGGGGGLLFKERTCSCSCRNKFFPLRENPIVQQQ